MPSGPMALDATLPDLMPPDPLPSDPLPPDPTALDATLPDLMLPDLMLPDPVPLGAGWAGRDRPAPRLIELRDVSLGGVRSPQAGSPRRGGRGRHERQPAPGRGPTAQAQAPGPGLVNLSVRHGELITLTGPTGSGKSALLHVIGLVDRPAAGSYLLNGRDTARLGERDRAALRGRQIGMQFQRPHLLPARSALDNVALPLRYSGLRSPQRSHTALAALDRVGLADRAQVIAAELSVAERKLVAIARALATGPSLVLFDDPTAGLDGATAARVISLLIGMHRDGRTVLIATDDQFAAAYSSQRIALAGRQ